MTTPVPFDHSDDASIVAALRLARPDCDSNALADGVMVRVESAALGRVLKSAAPVPVPKNAMADDVMARITGQPPVRKESLWQGRNPRAGSKSFAYWMRYVGVSAASVLLGVVIMWPSETPESAAPDQSPVVMSQAEQSVEAAPMAAQVRDVRFFEGQLCAVIDAGLVRGVRIGDRFLDHEGNSISVIGVAPFTSICALENAGLKGGGFVHFQGSTPTLRESQRFLEMRKPLPGAFFGLGARFIQRDNSWVVSEVFGDYWYEENTRPQPSIASRLGLKRGDRLVGVNGRAVFAEQDIERALAVSDPALGKVTLMIERDGAPIQLSDRAESVLPAGR